MAEPTPADRVETYLDERTRRGHRDDVIGKASVPRQPDPALMRESDLRALIAHVRETEGGHLVVGPEEVLVVHVGNHWTLDNVQSLDEMLTEHGVHHVIIGGDDVTLAKTTREEVNRG